jgi:hypothetical protein
MLVGTWRGTETGVTGVTGVARATSTRSARRAFRQSFTNELEIEICRQLFLDSFVVSARFRARARVGRTTERRYDATKLPLGMCRT